MNINATTHLNQFAQSVQRDVSQPFSHTQELEKRNQMSCCVSDIFVYVHDIYADSFLGAYCPCRSTR